MTTEELDQIRKIIREETVSKEDLQASEERIKAEFRQEIEASEQRIKAELTAVVEAKVEELADDMAEFFHKTWGKMDETNNRVTIIEDHLGLPHQTDN